MNYRASQTTRVTLDTDRVIASNTVTVFGILVANGLDRPVDIEFQDGAGNLSFNIITPCKDTEIMGIDFIADGGLVVSGLSSAEVVVTVFHTHEGT